MTSELTTYLAIAALVIVIAVMAFNQLGDNVIELTEYTSRAISGGVKR